MKKITLALAALLCATAVQAEKKELVKPKFGDNVRIGLNLGISSPLQFNYGDPHFVIGAEVRKDFTPIFGAGIEGRWEVGTPHYMKQLYGASKNVFDGQYVGVFGTVNFMNLFGGYKGEPRTFEIEAQAGLGWLHYYYSSKYDGKPDFNSWGTKAGLNFNFNVGSTKAWTISLRPYVMYDLAKDMQRGVAYDTQSLAAYDVRRATFNVEVGFAYKFKCSNGTHNFALERPYDQAEIDALNGKINALHRDINDVDGKIGSANDEIARLKAALAACVATPKVVETETVTKSSNLESVVTFAKAASTVAPAQLPNVERVATYLKNHSNAKVVIRGFASPEGNPEVNARLATARAEAVKNLLVNKYKIAASRIDAEGNGVGDMFSEPDWNRVSICTINE